MGTHRFPLSAADHLVRVSRGQAGAGFTLNDVREPHGQAHVVNPGVLVRPLGPRAMIAKA